MGQTHGALTLTLPIQWSTGLRIDVAVGDEEKSFFAKLIEREEFVGMAEAEYEGQKAISAVIPEHAVEPIAWGYYEGDRTKAWFLTHFRNLVPRPPPLSSFLPVVKKLHQESVSPTGKFGFHVTPFYGPPPMIVSWTDNWEKFWTREFRSGLEYVQRMRGEDPELAEIAEEFIDKVVPRLLRPLQTGGRNIKPSLCHGDLWDGNIQIDWDTKKPMVFDPCPFYGHCEMDLQCMRSPRYVVGLDFVKEYSKGVGKSEPIEDFDDRNALYAIAKEEMLRLLDKHPNGLAGFKGDLTPTVTTKADHVAVIEAKL
ncbi:uncharacterized protein THITE_123229 [Thermothielavioides terrestris NRRL 8126]|uniref:protein-ribulosamine 3-kinase n=1 Tax=Thermothielavioides terrestris (strain ATCC 38088 / NRRL 8126) TaxID=578455 RepID=G2RCY2_THETT|nr:uncharacterized protein THITE_123229 [Thermothielavioides terrestris NRRL 8126]AEO69870.1 hypothetical protein THITE_123229 [Thermothielavioides terrestris NRRL 8126]